MAEQMANNPTTTQRFYQLRKAMRMAKRGKATTNIVLGEPVPWPDASLFDEDYVRKRLALDGFWSCF
jgi:hypothetical protein